MRSRKRRGGSIPAGAVGQRAMVAIVGRPNVGKSTLFNKLAGKRLAIVEDIPGVTRDRHYADAWAMGRAYVLIDTGGFDPESDDPMKEGIAAHVEMALEECDVVICVVDATVPPLSSDREAVQLLRAAGKPVLYVANKSDSRADALDATQHYELGMDHLLPVSALHGVGMGDLEEALADALPDASKDEGPTELDVPKIAIVGRPNAGKSSLVNRLIGEDRQLVDDRPGTTVDSVDSLIERGDKSYVLIDTAGMRRKRSLKKKNYRKDLAVEASSVYHAIRAMERSHVVVLMIDAHAGVGEQDAKIAGLAVDRGRALVIALNKTDLMSRDDIKKAIERTRDVLAFASWAPVIAVSAKQGRGVKKLITTAHAAVVEHRKRITTSEINRFFEDVLEKHPPPTMKNRSVRLYFVTQAEISPPTFIVVTNEPRSLHFSYQRYVINQIRKRFGFEGTPIRVRYRDKNRKKKK